MKKPSLPLVLFLLLFAVVVIVSLVPALSIRKDKNIPFNAPPEATQLVNDNTAFALDLYQQLKLKPGNLFFSPFGISAALSMAHLGARGTTEAEMRAALRSTLAASASQHAWHALNERIESICSRRTQIETANAIYFQEGVKPLPPFEKAVDFAFEAETRSLDFIRDSAGASRAINRWIENHTSGAIKDFSTPNQFGPETRIVLCNAIYFHGRWKTEFDPDYTHARTFFRDETNTVSVQMMHKAIHTRAVDLESDSVGLLELPYSGENLSLVILLPKTNTVQNLTELENSLTVETLRSWLENLRGTSREDIQVSLPRFSAANGFSLNADLEQLGMRLPFSARADFSGIHGQANIYISEVLHKAKVEVEEQGTRAAASTSFAMESATAPAAAREFYVDRPFLFLIRDNGSGAILFMGRIVDPSLE